jgi:thiamine-phosphate pyrophosphorylase
LERGLELKKLRLPLIYPITDKKLARRSTHLSILKELARGGAELVQIRDKSTPLKDLLRDLRQCVEFAQKKGLTLIVNDRCDLVLSGRASGVHLGQEDLPPAAARSLLGENSVIGLSTHSLSQVEQSFGLPLQYIGFGPVFGTTTKENPSPAAGLQELAQACRISAVPVVAIGGIGLEQVRSVLNAGAASAAVISALMNAENLALQMECFLQTARAR